MQPLYETLACFATAGREIKTGPSQNKLELIDPGAFSGLSFSRKQNAREHRKFTTGAWAFDSAIDPGAVFLYGATTLRDT